MVSGARIKHVCFYGCGEITCQRVLEFHVAIHVMIPSRLPRSAIRLIQNLVNGTLRHNQLLVFAGYGGRELEVCVGDQTRGACWSSERIGQHAEQFFHFAGTNMILLSEQVVKEMSVDGEL